MKAIKIGTKIEIYNDTVMTFNELPARAYIVRFEKMTGFYLMSMQRWRLRRIKFMENT